MSLPRSPLLPRLAVIALLLPLAGCQPGALPHSPGPLPGASDALPHPGCTIVSVADAEALPTSEGNGLRRARLRHVADCLPDGPGATQPYRIQFVQEFTEGPEGPGQRARWTGSETRFDDTQAPLPRKVDAAREGLGKNCSARLEYIERRAIPCVRARDAATGAQLQQRVQAFRQQSQFLMNANGENHLQSILLGRDAHCLHHWDQMKRQLETPLQACFVE